MKLDRNKPYGRICGEYEDVPGARFEQGGVFFNARGDLCAGQKTPAEVKASPKPRAGKAKADPEAVAKGKAKKAEAQAAAEANAGAGEGEGEGEGEGDF